MAKRRSKRKLRVMVDANILIAGIVWRRWPYEVLRHAARKHFRLVLCPQIIEEASERLSEYSPAQERYLERFLEVVDFELAADPGPKQIARNPSLLSDPVDIPIGLAAMNAKVDYFVSEDKHFTERNTATKQFHRKVRVMLSGTFLREVMGWTHDELETVRERS